MKAKIIVPIYKTDLSDTEEMAFSQLLKILGKYPLVVVQPEGLDTSSLVKRGENMEVETFPPDYFRGIEGYNRLLLSSLFYERFLASEYILICQLDVFVFRDELLDWCDKGYDYIGAPWIATPRNAFIPRMKRFFEKLSGKENPREAIFFRTGNGGFSLRKTAVFHTIATEHQSLIHGLLQEGKKEICSIEDVFWSIKAPELYPGFTIPGYKEALQFAVDRKPEIAMKINGGNLPFGCHGFNKPKVWKFWKPILEGLR